jgi:transcriptional regulator with XRE-family HTH domain
MTLGERFAYYRKKKGLSQKEAAQLMELDPYRLSNYETDRSDPPIAVLLTMSRTYHVSVDELLGNPPIQRDEDPNYEELLKLIDSYVGEEKEKAIDIATTIIKKI